MTLSFFSFRPLRCRPRLQEKSVDRFRHLKEFRNKKRALRTSFLRRRKTQTKASVKWLVDHGPNPTKNIFGRFSRVSVYWSLEEQQPSA